jgi:hypothetical protein
MGPKPVVVFLYFLKLYVKQYIKLGHLFGLLGSSASAPAFVIIRPAASRKGE